MNVLSLQTCLHKTQQVLKKINDSPEHGTLLTWYRNNIQNDVRELHTQIQQMKKIQHFRRSQSQQSPLSQQQRQESRQFSSLGSVVRKIGQRQGHSQTTSIIRRVHKMIIFLIYNLTNGAKKTKASSTYLQKMRYTDQPVIMIGQSISPTDVVWNALTWFNEELLKLIPHKERQYIQYTCPFRTINIHCINGGWVSFGIRQANDVHGVAVGSYVDPIRKLCIVLFADQGTKVQAKSSGIRCAVIPSVPIQDSDTLTVGKKVVYMGGDYQGHILRRQANGNVHVKWTRKKVGQQLEPYEQEQTLSPQYLQQYTKKTTSLTTLQNKIFEKNVTWALLETFFPADTTTFLFPLPKQRLPICQILADINRVVVGLTLCRFAGQWRGHVDLIHLVNETLTRTYQEIDSYRSQIVEHLIQRDIEIIKTPVRQDFDFYSY